MAKSDGPFYMTEGTPYPLGATLVKGGVNFALFSANAEKVELCLFSEDGDREIARLELVEQTDDVWHGFVPDLQAGSLYGYRVYGPYEPQRGHRFNHHKLLIDPYARRLHGKFQHSEAHLGYQVDDPAQDLSFDTRDNAHLLPKAVVCAPTTPPAPIATPVRWSDTVIYETHVKGHTRLHPDVPAQLRGTYAGLAHPAVIDYLLDLGITTVELLPVHGFISEEFLVKRELVNYWGYNSLHFFVPHRGYLSQDDPAEFSAMVQKFHEAGLEVVLDVVYNHTAEGNHLGPTISFRGIDNASYYGLQNHEPRFYVNDTGCGNTLNVRHPRVLQMVMDSLRYWATEMGVDGFRFDLATVLGRENHGFDPGSGFFDAVRQDPVLASKKLIAEPWDIGPGGYQLGRFPNGWSEWNDRYRDTCRRFWRGDPGMLPEFARRIHGSSDLFEHSTRKPSASVNFITSHDGFTLSDLVRYTHRHNLANKEQNNDGHHANFSYNYGIEGETEDKNVNELRARQQRNFLATLLLSQGTPMLLAGDELGRTQHGNNNAYCQDNEISWICWQTLLPKNEKLMHFVCHVLQIRREFPLLRSGFYIHKPDEVARHKGYNIHWLNEDGEPMRDHHWTEQRVHTLGWMLESHLELGCVHCLLTLFNADTAPVEFTLPGRSGEWVWKALLNTAMDDGGPVEPLDPAARALTLKERSMFILYGFSKECKLTS